MSASIVAPNGRKGICLAVMPWNPRRTTLIGTTRAGKPKNQKTHWGRAGWDESQQKIPEVVWPCRTTFGMAWPFRLKRLRPRCTAGIT